MEVTDICMDKESDHVVYSNGVSHDSIDETASQFDDLDSPEHINGNPVPSILKENTEAKECEVKECTTKDSVEISKAFQVEKSEEQDILSSKCESGLSEEKMKSESQNTKDDCKNSGALLKPATKSISGNVKTKYTVPQPFALATEKRALCGTRPTGPGTDSLTPASKSSHVNSLHIPVPKKQNEVTLVDLHQSLIYYALIFLFLILRLFCPLIYQSRQGYTTVWPVYIC